MSFGCLIEDEKRKGHHVAVAKLSHAIEVLVSDEKQAKGEWVMGVTFPRRFDTCVNGCDVPPANPDEMYCQECLDRIARYARNWRHEIV